MSDDDNIRPPYLIAELWWCGDETCDCVQPQITLITPNHPYYPPWIKRETKWMGTYHSQPEPEEMEQMKQELREASKKFGIPFNEKTMTGILHV